jgi:hypothetical protein
MIADRSLTLSTFVVATSKAHVAASRDFARFEKQASNKTLRVADNVADVDPPIVGRAPGRTEP